MNLTKIREKPKDNHWSQSPLEKVTDARVLLDRDYFVLTKTEFLAPKLIKHATWKTEYVGKTHKRIFELCDNSGSYKDIVRWFYTIMLPESYEQGDFPHQDYTFYVHNPRTTAFVNLREFPQESYLVDIIDAEVTLYDSFGNIINGGAVSSYQSEAKEDDSLLPMERTITLEQLSKQNRLRQGKIVVQTSDGEYETPFEEGQMTFVNYSDLSTLHSFDIGGDVMDRVHAADLSEIALQRVLTSFKYLLEECCVNYRKNS